jgi:hypothetical protein
LTRLIKNLKEYRILSVSFQLATAATKKKSAKHYDLRYEKFAAINNNTLSGMHLKNHRSQE